MNVISLPRPTPPSASAAKFVGLDALRGFAALWVVLFHACIPYLTHPMPGLTWAVRDQSSDVVDFLYWWTELFIMPLFLVMAGFFAWKTLQVRGETELIRSRAARLLKPLLFGIVVVLPIDLYCWVLGWVADGIVPANKLRSLKFDAEQDQNLWGLSHLWFLQYLFLYVVVLALASRLRSRFSILQRIQPGPSSVVSLIVLAGTLTLTLCPEVVWGFQHDFAPVPSKWIYSGLGFALGVSLAAFDSELMWVKSQSMRFVAPAAICSAAAVLLGQWHLSSPQDQQAQIALAALTCVGSILMTLSIISLAASKIASAATWTSYLAAASFWVYIVHHPILGLVHTDLKYLLPGASPVVKTLLAFGITAGVSLASYEAFVRKTSLGRWLGFGWEFPTTQPSTEPRSIPLSTRRPRAEIPSRRAA